MKKSAWGTKWSPAQLTGREGGPETNTCCEFPVSDTKRNT